MIGNIGAAEVLVVLALALVIFGPKKLPEIGRSFGKTLHEFRRASFTSFNDIEAEIKDAEYKEAEAKKRAEAIKTEAIEEGVKASPPEPTPIVAKAEEITEETREETK